MRDTLRIFYMCVSLRGRYFLYTWLCRRGTIWAKDMSWGGDQLLFDESHTFYFAPELSNGTLDGEIVTVDIVVASVSETNHAVAPNFVQT